MGLEKVTSAIAAALSFLSTSSQTSGTLVSSYALRPLSSPFRSPWSTYGRAANLRLSSSLQDFSTYCKVIPEDSVLIRDSISRTRSASLSPITGGCNSFSKEKNLSLLPSRSQYWRKLWLIFLFILAMFILGFMLFGWLKSYQSYEIPQYSIILDCGSTGTRVYVYEWIQNKGKDQGNLPLLLHPFPENADPKSRKARGRAYHRMETEPGLDKLVNNDVGLKAALEPLLRWAANKIPSQSHRSTPVFLLATAGLRRLPSYDSEWILDKAWSILEASPFMCQRNWVKIISGVEEAYYGWVALNYIMNRLGKVPKEETLGALDLGGSSLQVTFEPKDLTQSDLSLNLSIGATKHHINAYSLGGYGLNDAFEKSILLLLRSKSGSGNVKFANGILHVNHPCLQRGYKHKYPCSMCSSVLHGGSPLVAEKDIDQQNSEPVIELIGKPNWDKCKALALSAVNSSEWSQATPGLDCKHSSCAISKNQPQPQGNFYAMSGFYVVYNFFNLTSAASFDEVLVKGKEFCAKSWKDAKRSVVPQPFVEQYCFRAPYVVSLLQYGLHLIHDQVVVGSGTITWTLGAALMEAGSMLLKNMGKEGQPPLAILKSQRFLDSTYLAVALLMLILMLVVAFCIFRKGILRAWHKPYLSLFGQHPSNGTPPKFGTPFRPQQRSPASNGVSQGRSDIRPRIPLSPSMLKQPFGAGQTVGTGNIPNVELFSHQSPGSVGLSFSSGNLSQLQNDNGIQWAPLRGQTGLQSRRSQSREDLCLAMQEAHIVKL